MKMPSTAAAWPTVETRARGAAEALLGTPIDAVVPAGRGGNSRIFRIERGKERFALKFYPPPTHDQRDRLGTEFHALQFMRGSGIENVPRAIASEPSTHVALYEWIEGSPLTAYSPPDLAAAAEFLERLHRLREAPGAAALGPGSEACTSGGEIVSQIERRYARLRRIDREEPALEQFLERRFQPAFEEILAWVRAGYKERNFRFEAEIPQEALTLCPSDFGFHNALRREDGGLVFIDFEYFGWDDPAKLISDFLLHPGMQLDGAQKNRIAAAARKIYRHDPTFADRLVLLYPLFGLRWCMILLNEYLPERWANRLHSGVDREWGAARRQQLEHAARLLDAIRSTYTRFLDE